MAWNCLSSRASRLQRLRLALGGKRRYAYLQWVCLGPDHPVISEAALQDRVTQSRTNFYKQTLSIISFVNPSAPSLTSIV